MDIGIVILNYLNWQDTVECVESILKQKKIAYEIVIVDNCSNNESLAELQKRYSQKANIQLITTNKNLGFAKGNNTGIVYCKDVLGVKNVFATNNDVIFTDDEYFYKLINKEIASDVGAIGTRIKGSDGINQNPINLKSDFYTLVKHLVEPTLANMGFGRALESIHRLVQKSKKNRRKDKNDIPDIKSEKTNDNYFLHGSAVYFTENYLNKADGFHPDTFLYYEENILAIVFEKLNLKMKYFDDIEMYHKEDQSMALSFKDVSKSKRRLQRKSIITAMKIRIQNSTMILKSLNNYKYDYRRIN